MSQSWKRVRVVMLLTFVMVSPVWLAAQCFSKVEIPVNIKKSVDFEVDIDQYIGPALKQNNIPDSATTIPQGAPAINVPVKFNQTFDISNESAIKTVGNKLTGAQVKSMLVAAESNSLTANLPGFDIVMADKGTAEPTDVVANLSGIPAGKTGDIEDLVKTGGQTAKMESYILKFAFEVGVRATITLKAGDTIPRGKAKLKVTFDLTVKVAPFK